MLYKIKSKILELRARDNSNDNCFFSLASDLGHDYFYILADKADVKKTNHLSDLVINPEKFSFELKNMLNYN